ncbi:Zinc finger, SWIM-type [Sesbania bispinosa]|nr:Zinc finger, SWIM-type [Sesbania bispinosa]
MQGKRISSGPKKREAKPETRCECLAMFCVRKELLSGGWYVKIFNDDHNHGMLENKYCGMMAAHRKMTESDIMEMNSMRSVGISVPDIYASFASRSGGYDKVGFRIKDMYNQIDKQRRFQRSDAKTVLSDIVSNETEDTYVWLLQQFKDAMKRKSPKAVIIDGDMAMRNAIKRVFPGAHHRLCSWHLLRNATSNVGIPAFLEELERCVFAHVEVVEFSRRWRDMVCKYNLEDNNWVKDLYEKKHMWATTYITGQFFAGLRTTSRCESLHGQLGRQSAMWMIYTIKRYQSGGKEWYVSFYPPSNDFKCCCQRMESYGLSCPHIIFVLVYLDYAEIPPCLILQRQMCNLAVRCDEDFNHIKEWINSEIQRLKDKYGDRIFEQDADLDGLDSGVFDPVRVRTKGCPRASTSVPSKGRRKNKCSRCGGLGHNKNVVLKLACYNLLPPLVGWVVKKGEVKHCGSPLIGQSQLNSQAEEGCSNGRGT